MRDEVQGVLPRHIGILETVQNVHGSAGIERVVADEMLTPLFE